MARPDMLIAEDLLLLVTDDTSGRLSVSADQVDAALGGATLVELTLMNKVDLSGGADAGKPGRIAVRDPSPVGDQVLDAALETLTAHRGDRPSAAIRPLSRHLRRTLYERLAATGVIRAEHARVLGVFPVDRWPAQDASHEAEVRQRLADALVRQATPDSRTAALIALLHALRCEHKIIDPAQSGLTRRELRARAGRIAQGDWASQAVRKAIDEMMAAVVAASSAAAGGAG